MTAIPGTWCSPGSTTPRRGATGTGFAGCTETQREAIVGEFAQGRLVGGAWDELNVTRAWSVCMRIALAAFYSHPWAWNEIGFGGPAYPRGFMRLADRRARRAEPFEKPGATDEDPVREVGEGGARDGHVLARPPQRRDRARRQRLRASCSTCTRRDLPGEDTMRRYADSDEVDLVIVGAGAGGSVLAQRLARPAGES